MGNEFARPADRGAGAGCYFMRCQSATFHSSDDVDFYRLEVMDANTPIIAETYGGVGQRQLMLGYECPGGEPGMVGCHGETESTGGYEFCTSNEGVVGIERWCESKSGTGGGTLMVGVLPDDYVGECAGYGLKIIATYGIGLPTF